MSITISTNLGALKAQKYMNVALKSAATAMERLSSGLRLNSARDDAAGLAISTRMTAQIQGLNQAIRNANDATSLAQTGESGLNEITNILLRVRQLANQSANDTNSSTDRQSIQKEVNMLVQEVSRVANVTTFNGTNLLLGSFVDAKFQIGDQANQTIKLDIKGASAQKIGTNLQDTNDTHGLSLAATANAAAVTTNARGTAEDLTISGGRGSKTFTVAAGLSASAISDLINTHSKDTSVNATASTSVTVSTLAANGTISFELNGGGVALKVEAAVTTTDLSAMKDAINNTAGSHQVSASFGSSLGELILTNDTGEDISITDFTHSVATTTISVKGGANSAAQSLESGAADSTRVGGTVQMFSSSDFSASSSVAGNAANATGLLNVAAGVAVNGTLNSVSSIDVSTEAGSQLAMKIADGGLETILGTLSDLGAFQNRLDSTVANLTNGSEQLSSARSRIRDADYAVETSTLSKFQVIQQAGSAMLTVSLKQTQSVLQIMSVLN